MLRSTCNTAKGSSIRSETQLCARPYLYGPCCARRVMLQRVMITKAYSKHPYQGPRQSFRTQLASQASKGTWSQPQVCELHSRHQCCIRVSRNYICVLHQTVPLRYAHVDALTRFGNFAQPQLKSIQIVSTAKGLVVTGDGITAPMHLLRSLYSGQWQACNLSCMSGLSKQICAPLVSAFAQSQSHVYAWPNTFGGEDDLPDIHTSICSRVSIVAHCRLLQDYLQN